MFTVEQYSRNAYRPVGRKHSKGSAAFLMHALRSVGKVRIKNARGVVVLAGRMVKSGDRFEFKAE